MDPSDGGDPAPGEAIPAHLEAAATTDKRHGDCRDR
jgi:hypothetical protein